MDIDLHPVTIREVVEGYTDDGEGGVFGYGGRLNIRPPYQREFVYKQKKRDAVIDTIFKGFPLNVFYWVENEDGTFEILDGQQRTISLSQYANGDFSIDVNGNLRYFPNLTADEQERFLDYELLVYRCKGTDSEKLEWFRTINIAGEELTDQELYNATYYGPWLTHAKSIFSKTGGAAYNLGDKYLVGEPIRQKYLETALKWISERDGLSHHKQYMAAHQHDQNANELWSYFRSIIYWVEDTFTTYRGKLMKGQPWGPLYNTYGANPVDTAALEAEIADLVQDKEVTNNRGIYQYVLSRDPKHLNLRQFDDDQRLEMYERQGGRCANGTKCKDVDNGDGMKTFDITTMDADHIVPWSKGGKTEVSNGQMLCISCNRSKGSL
ncbi:DUF262 domain-containing protein [Gordonia amicalis]|uniref:HNH endonuclease family protein n=1 Tax=Gordonia amicalis TaxID=89053 RepID=UPI0022B5D91E|nr:DUF262 domain-containing protein [Gordonia amicalis]MCZ4652709.1 DUF262 domain-containing protein [Gordonia amicalis]